MSSTILLRDYYLSEFRPSIVDRFTYGRVQQYDRAVEAIDRFAGGSVGLAFIGEKLLSEFIAQPIDRQGAPYHRNLADCVRTIVRSWDPAALAKPRDCQIPVPLAAATSGTLRHYLDAIYIPRAMLGCSRGAKDNNRLAIRVLSEHYGRDPLLSELNDELAADHFQWLLDRGVPAITINSKHRSAIFAVWRHAFKHGATSTEPRISKLQEDRREPSAWTLDQTAAVFAAALRFRPQRQYHGIPRNLFWHALLLVCWWTALRRSALFSLRRADVNLQTGWLAVQPSTMKNRRGKKFRLGPDAIVALTAIWQPDRELLFPGLGKRWMYREFDLILAAAGIPRSDRPGFSKFHAIRRTVATQTAIAAGIPTASALLGHSSSEVTLRYVDPTHLPGCDATQFFPMVAPPVGTHGAGDRLTG